MKKKNEELIVQNFTTIVKILEKNKKNEERQEEDLNMIARILDNLSVVTETLTERVEALEASQTAREVLP